MSLFTRTRLLILRELVHIGDDRVHLRELARRAGLDPSGISRELKNLTGSGIVDESRIANLKLYSLNRHCPIYHELRMLMLKTVGFADQIRDALESLHPRIDHAYIYGSFASGTERADSDIDLMVVGDVRLREVTRAISGVGRKLGRVINPTVLSHDEYSRQLRKPKSFMQRVSSGDKIRLIGDENSRSL